MNEPHQFEPFHRAMREPFDYYALGCDFAEGVIDRETSTIVGEEHIQKIQAQVEEMMGELFALILPLVVEAVEGLFDSIIKEKDSVVPKFVAALDVDSDGRIVKEEFISTLSTAMDAATNLDGRQQEVVASLAPKIELAVQGLVQKLAASLEKPAAAAEE